MTRFSPSVPVADRIRTLVEVTPQGCWSWKGRLDEGYGVYSYQRKNRRAHRLSYETFVGTIPDGMEVDHLCRNRRCVNPDHLEPVTKRENWRRGESKTRENAQKTHCLNGHELSGDNLYVRPDGGRMCRKCNNARAAAYRERARMQGTV